MTPSGPAARKTLSKATPFLGPTPSALANLKETLIWCYAPVLTALVAALLFALADPVHEIMLVFAQDTKVIFSVSKEALDSLLRLLLSIAGVVLMTWGLWHATRYCVINSKRGRAIYTHDFGRGATSLTITKDLSWTPHIVAALPLLGLVLGLTKTAISGEADGLEVLILYVYLLLLILFTSFVLRSSTFRDVSGSWFETAKRAFKALYVYFFVTGLLDYVIPDGSFQSTLLIVWIGLYLCGFFYGLMADEEKVGEDPYRLLGLAGILAVTLLVLLLGALSGWPAEEIGFFAKVELVLKQRLDILFVLYAAVSIVAAAYGPPPRVLTLATRKKPAKWGLRFGRFFLVFTVVSIFVTWLWPSLWINGGPFFVGTMFFGALAMNSAWLAAFGARRLRGFPILPALVVLAVILGAFGISGQHRVTGAPGFNAVTPETALGFDSYEAAATAWLQATQADTGPIYLVAAEGGGLYAGYHAAYDLARRRSLTKEEDNISGRVFAISGVSGGSVGAATYWAQDHCATAQDCATQEAPTDAVRNMLERDFLTPVVAGLLFTDFADAFSGLARLTKFERGVALKEELAHAIELNFGSPTRHAFGQSIRHTGQGSTPLLLINVTQLHDGRLLTFSPIQGDGLKLDGGPKAQDMPIGDAVTASARFPVVTPPSRVHFDGDALAPSQLIDGGYFDNTGLVGLRPALDGLIAAQQSLGRAREIRVLMYRVSSTKETSRRAAGVLSTPFTGLNATRTARNDIAISTFEADYQSKVRLYSCALSTEDFEFTLSWLLSQTTFAAMRAQIEAQGYCPEQTAD